MSLPSASGHYLYHLKTFSRNAKLYLVATVFQGLGSGVWGVLFYLYLKLPEVGFKDDFIGNLFTASAIATGLIALPAGLLCERIGPKRAILIGILANLVNVAQITVLQPAGLLIASLISGLIGTVAWVSAAPLLMEDSRPEERTYLFSFQSTLSIIMSVVGSFIGGVMPNLFNSALGLSTRTASPVLGHGGRGRLGHPMRAPGLPTGPASSVLGYRISLAVAIAFSLSVGFPVLLMKRSANSDTHRMSDLLALKNIRSSKTIIKFMIPTSIIGFGAGFVVPLVNPFFLDRYKATSVEIGVISALGNVTLGLATLVVPILSSRLSKVKSVTLCQFLSMPFIMLTSLSPSLTWAASSYIVRTALMNMAGPVGTTLQMELVTPAERATTNGLMVMSDNIPRAATATVSGILLTKGDYFTPFLCMTVAYFAAASSYFAFFRKVEARKASQSSSRDS